MSEGGLAMDTKLNCRCENCGRTAEAVEMEVITIHHHKAQLCVTCAHVLTLPQNEGRFLQLVRKSTRKESDKDMQKVHQVMSVLLAVGALFLVIIAAAGVSQGIDFISLSTDGVVEIETEYVSFVYINDYN